MTCIRELRYLLRVSLVAVIIALFVRESLLLQRNIARRIAPMNIDDEQQDVSLKTYFDEDKDRRREEVLSKYTWIAKRNHLPNFFLRPYTSVEENLKWPPDDMYRNGTTVFLHNQKSGGTTTKKCWKWMLLDKGEDIPILAANTNAEEFYTDILRNGSHQNLAKSYMGDSSFGICDLTDNACSYFTVLRDPYERVISSHNMCKTAMQAQCVVWNATRVLLRDWAISQGSFFFKQLLANPVFFTKKYLPLVDKLKEPIDPPLSMIPPWRITDLIVQHMFTNDVQKILLEYILDNMEHWFAVIGLTDQYETNFLLFEHVYNLPFPSRCDGMKRNTHGYTIEGQEAIVSKEEIVETLREELASDPEVTRALYYDNEIYKKAKDIFRRQKIAYERHIA